MAQIEMSGVPPLFLVAQGKSPACHGVSETWYLQSLLAGWRRGDSPEGDSLEVVRRKYIEHPALRFLVSPTELGFNTLLLQLAPTYLLVCPEKLAPAITNQKLYNAIQLISFAMGMRQISNLREPIVFSTGKHKSRFSKLSSLIRDVFAIMSPTRSGGIAESVPAGGGGGGEAKAKVITLPIEGMAVTSSTSPSASSTSPEEPASLPPLPAVTLPASSIPPPPLLDGATPLPSEGLSRPLVEERPFARVYPDLVLPDLDAMPSSPQSPSSSPLVMQTQPPSSSPLAAQQQPLPLPSSLAAQQQQPQSLPLPLPSPLAVTPPPHAITAPPPPSVERSTETPPLIRPSEMVDLEEYLWNNASLFDLSNYFGVDPRVFHDYSSIDGESLLSLALRMSEIERVQLFIRICPTLVGRIDPKNGTILSYLTSIANPERMARSIASSLSTTAFLFSPSVGPSPNTPQRALLHLFVHDIAYNEGKGVDLLRREGFRNASVFSAMVFQIVDEFARAWGLSPDSAFSFVSEFKAKRSL
ncbi:MAG: hypothetical protein WC483_00510 [Candidatus Paceibacterota bacterium]